MNIYGPWSSKNNASDDRDLDPSDTAMEVSVNGFLSLIDPFETQQVPIRVATHISKCLDSKTVVTFGLREFPFGSSSTPARVLMVTSQSSFTLDKVHLPDGRLAFVVEPPPFNFAGLPKELRDMVFRLHYDTDKVVSTWTKRSSAGEWKIYAQPALTREETSPFYLGKVIGREALCAFYRYTEFCLGNTKAAAQFLRSIRPFVPGIRRFRILRWFDASSAHDCMKRLILAVNLQMLAVHSFDAATTQHFVEASEVWLMANGNSDAAVDKLTSKLAVVYCHACRNQLGQLNLWNECRCALSLPGLRPLRRMLQDQLAK